MPKTRQPIAEENIFQKEKRLKSRKAVYTEIYKKGVYIANKETLIDWIK